MNQETLERSYIAFISYRHQPLDREAAIRVQKRIENYIVPKELREKTGSRKLGFCFRDEDELPASSSLNDSIYYALDHSKFLIVICTPDLPLSKWCEAEIKYFLKTHDRDHVLAVLADGTPDVSFSPYMLHDYDEEGNIIKDWEPLAANIDGKNHTINNRAFKKEIVRLCAAMIGCPFDELWQRERRARMQRYMAVAVGIVVVMAVFLGVVMNRNAQISAANEQITAQNDQIIRQNNELTEKNTQIEEQKNQIEEQNEDLQRQLSAVLVDSGRQKLEAYDVKGALSDGLEALKSDDPDVYDHRAEKLLADALGVYQADTFQTDTVYEQAADITGIYCGEKTNLIIIVDEDGNVRALDPSTYTMIWEYNCDDAHPMVYEAKDGACILCKSTREVCALSPEDGSVIWSRKQFNGSTYQGISDDGSIFAIVDTASEAYSTSEYTPVYTIFLDTKDGSEIGRVLISEEGKYYIDLHTAFIGLVTSGAFSPDKKKFSMFYAAEDPEKDSSDYRERELCLFCEIDLTTMTKRDITCFPCGLASLSYGFSYSEDSDKLFTAFYSGNDGAIRTALYPEGTKSDTVVENKRTHSWKAYLSLYAGFAGSDYIALANAKVFPFEEFYLVISTDELCVARNENSDIGHIPFQSLITGVYWGDETHSKLNIITSDGLITVIQSREKGSLSQETWAWGAMPENLKMTAAIYGGPIANPENGVFLSVTKDMPGKILCTKRIADPGIIIPEYQNLLNPEDFILPYFNVQLCPDSDGAMLFTDQSINGGEEDVLNGIGFNRKTGKVTGSRSNIDDNYYGSRIVLDDKRFLLNGIVYNLDGEDEVFPLEQLPQQAVGWGGIEHRRLCDGHILSFWPSSVYFDLCYPVWLDSELVKESNNVNTGLNFEELDEYKLGENGVVMGYGIDIEQDGNQPVSSSEKRFSFFNALTGSLTKMENAHPEAEGFLTALGTNSPIFAAAYTNGCVSIYNLDTLTIRELPKKYRSNEIKGICFSEGDKYIILLTSEKRFEIYDTQTLEKLFSEVPNLDIRSISNINLQARFSADGSRLFILAGQHTFDALFVDTSTWTIQATIPCDVLAVDIENETLYTRPQLFEGHFILNLFPIYSLGDLKEMAAKALEET